MGCFPGLGYKKRKSGQFINNRTFKLEVKVASPLPEPEQRGPSLQSAPPSFRNRSGSSHSSHSAGRLASTRARARSAPGSLVLADQDALDSSEYDEQGLKSRSESIKDHQSSNPLPLPLPAQQDTSNSALRNSVSVKVSNYSGSVATSGPLPLPPLGGGGLRNFSYDEIILACQHFSTDRCISEGFSSTVYKAVFADDKMGSKKTEATVNRLVPSSQGLKEFVNEVTTLASLQHPQLCKLIGYHAREGSDERFLIYERLYHGSLDRLLYGRSESQLIDWGARMKVALCAARGLAFLHEEGPFQAMYYEFSAANIQVDKDFSAKLSGYGCVNHNPETDFPSSSVAVAYLSVETLGKGLLTPKSNIWSFGVVLLELLTGRKNLDNRSPKEERNIVKWSRPFLADNCRLSLVLDPRIKGRCPAQAARCVADLAIKCLNKDPHERPTMRAIVESLTNVQDMKCPSGYPLQEPSVVAGKSMRKSSSLNGIVLPVPVSNFSPSPPTKTLMPSRMSISVDLP